MLISVIIPTFNDGPYIFQCVKSIVGQTYKNIEIIVVVDGSTDDTEDILKRIRDPRLKIIVNRKNLGRAASRNIAIEESRGELIGLQDADDYSSPQRFEKQLKFMLEKPEADVVSCQAYFIDNGNIKKGFRTSTNPTIIKFKTKFGTTPVIHAASLFKKELFIKYGAYDSRLLRAQDYELFRRFINNGVKIYSLKEYLYYYRIRTERGGEQSLDHYHWYAYYVSKKKERGYKSIMTYDDWVKNKEYRRYAFLQAYKKIRLRLKQCL